MAITTSTKYGPIGTFLDKVSRNWGLSFIFTKIWAVKFAQYGSYNDNLANNILSILKEYDDTNNFKSFCSSRGQQLTTVRTVYDLDVTKEGSMVKIRVSGNGFLYNMVRIIAGTLIQVGNGNIAPDKIPEILEACDRNMAGPTAPANGLTMISWIEEIS